MAWAHVQTAVQVGTLANTVAKAFASDVTAGSLLNCTIGWYTSPDAIQSVVGSSSGAWTQVGSTLTYTTGNGDFRLAVFSKENAPGGADTITVTFDNVLELAPGLSISEYSGLATSGALDQTASNGQTNPGTGTDAITSGSVTTTAPNELIYSGSMVVDASGLTEGTGFTVRGADLSDGSFFRIKVEDKNLAAAGSVAATFTTGSATSDSLTIIATFKEPGGGGGSRPVNMVGSFGGLVGHRGGLVG